MKKFSISILMTALMLGIGVGIFAIPEANAEGEPVFISETEGDPVETEKPPLDENTTSITLSPASQTIQISSNSSYKNKMSITNEGIKEITLEVYATPYSYIYSEEEDAYKLGYTFENKFTQISRWIKIKNENGAYESRPTFHIKPGETREIEYRVNTPDSIPAGGQYAVIFAQVKTPATTGTIKADPGLGMIIYGHSTEGQTIIESEISDIRIEQGIKNKNVEEKDQKSVYYGMAKVKNNGNVDFFSRMILKAEPIIGFSSYETPIERGLLSIIPETELIMTDEWTDMPAFGIYKLTWTIMAGNNTESVEQIVFINFHIFIIIVIILLTIIAISVTMAIKRRKARRSRLAI